MSIVAVLDCGKPLLRSNHSWFWRLHNTAQDARCRNSCMK